MKKLYLFLLFFIPVLSHATTLTDLDDCPISIDFKSENELKQHLLKYAQIILEAGIPLESRKITSSVPMEKWKEIQNAAGLPHLPKGRFLRNIYKFYTWEGIRAHFQIPEPRPKTYRHNIWTKERAIEVVRLLSEFQLNKGNALQAIGRIKPSSVTWVRLKKLIDESLTPDAVKQRCIALFGSWADTITAAGLEPNEQIPRLPKPDFDLPKDKIIQVLRLLAQHKLPINVRSFWRPTEEHLDAWKKALEEAGVEEIHPARFVRLSQKNFGNWNLALAAAELPKPTPKKDKAWWTRENTIRTIQYLFQKEMNLERKNVLTLGTITLNDGKEVASATLLKMSDLFFGSWKEALIAADIPGVKWTTETMVQTIQQMANEGLPLSFQAIVDLNRTSEEWPRWENFQKKTRISLSPRAIHERAIKLFGSWNKALEAADINPGFHVRKFNSPDLDLLPYEILDLLQEALNRQIPLEYSSFWTLNGDPLKQWMTLLPEKGLPYLHPSKIVRMSVAKFGSWKKAVTKAQSLQQRSK